MALFYEGFILWSIVYYLSSDAYILFQSRVGVFKDNTPSKDLPMGIADAIRHRHIVHGLHLAVVVLCFSS